jgi:hypothetical protein
MTVTGEAMPMIMPGMVVMMVVGMMMMRHAQKTKSRLVDRLWL